MTNDEIIEGLKFTMDMCLFSSVDGSKRPISMLNDMDKITYNACEGAIKLLEQQRWIPVSERLPEEQGCYLVTYKWKGKHSGTVYTETDVIEYDETRGKWVCGDGDIIAWMPLPEPYKPESESEYGSN